MFLAGAMCNVDRCEVEPALCHAVNVNGPKVVAEHARRSGALVVFFSTDHVFDGSSEEHSEADAVAPMNVYAKSKVMAEAVLRSHVPDQHLIFRTSWVYGPDPHRRNFVLRAVQCLSEGRPLTVPQDQWGSPTYTEDLANAACVLSDRGATGTFHATGSEFLSRMTLTDRICEHFRLDRDLVRPRPTRSLGQVAKRPLSVRLDCQELAATGIAAFRGVDGGLRAMKAWVDSSGVVG